MLVNAKPALCLSLLSAWIASGFSLVVPGTTMKNRAATEDTTIHRTRNAAADAAWRCHDHDHGHDHGHDHSPISTTITRGASKLCDAANDAKRTEPTIPRQVFWSVVGSGVALATGLSPATATASTPQDDRQAKSCSTDCSRSQTRVLSLTLRSLPVSGCWAVPVTLARSLDDSDNDNESDSDSDDEAFYTYLAVVDTGSPFLTAPPAAMRTLRPSNKGRAAAFAAVTAETTMVGHAARASVNEKHTRHAPFAWAERFRSKPKRQRQQQQDDPDDVSYEQYGNTIGGIQWRIAPYLTLVGNGEVDTTINAVTNDSVCGTAGQNKRCCSPLQTTRTTPVGITATAEPEAILVADQSDVVVGVPSATVIEETGGIFFGLMTVDATRPTPLQQLGYDAFRLRFGGGTNGKDKDEAASRGNRATTPSNDDVKLELWGGTQRQQQRQRQFDDGSSTTPSSIPSLINPTDPRSMRLFDLTPFGPNLHHYAVVCDRFECYWNDDGGNNRSRSRSGSGSGSRETLAFECTDSANGTTRICTNDHDDNGGDDRGFRLSRPLIAVFDTGLSGCIFSDTLWDEIRDIRTARKQQQQQQQQQQLRRSTASGSSGDEPTDEAANPSGCTVWLPTQCRSGTTSGGSSLGRGGAITVDSAVRLSSVRDHWRFQSFRLPWWYADMDTNAAESDFGSGSNSNPDPDARPEQRRDHDDDYRSNNFPHVVVLGSAFWRNPSVRELAIDTVSQRAKIATAT